MGGVEQKWTVMVVILCLTLIENRIKHKETVLTVNGITFYFKKATSFLTSCNTNEEKSFLIFVT